ncbi:MAG: Hpt domain-containing protein [Coriobacteriales bacterium]
MNEVLTALQQLGNDVPGALERFMGSEPMYLKFLGKLRQDETFGQLMAALDAGDMQTGFAASHTLKGLYGNLGLTKLVELNTPVVESLRAGALPSEADVAALKAAVKSTEELLAAL